MRSWVQVLETASCINAGKGCVHKTESGQILPRTLRKQELRASGCPWYAWKGCVHKTQGDRTLPQTWHKQELRAPGGPFNKNIDSPLGINGDRPLLKQKVDILGILDDK
jgi:hypothetical protein